MNDARLAEIERRIALGADDVGDLECAELLAEVRRLRGEPDSLTRAAVEAVREAIHDNKLVAIKCICPPGEDNRRWALYPITTKARDALVAFVEAAKRAAGG